MAFSVNGNVVPDVLKPAPVTEAALIVTAPVPVEVNVTDCVAGVFRSTVPKAMLVAFTLKVAVPGLVALPNLRIPEPRLLLSCFEVAVTVTVPLPAAGALGGAV